MDNGLCFGGGILSRGSCTDENWESDACAGYCKTGEEFVPDCTREYWLIYLPAENPSSGMAITPCKDAGKNSTFTCGLSNRGCQSDTFQLTGSDALVLRPTQIAKLVEPALASLSSSMAASATSSATSSSQTGMATSDPTSVPQIAASPSAVANGTKVYTSSDMAGLGCGLGLPLTFFLVVALCALYKERQNHTGPKLMYKLPDNHEEFDFRKPAPFPRTHSNYSVDSRITTRTFDHGKPANPHSFLDRYDSMKREGKISEFQVHEMDGVSPHEPAFRHELPDKRFSTPSGS